ncbi:hypothetical protein Sjap_001950 [Stephania japonica]|uniref:Uncharacterized protein n=1 Tax=Stephania japonica TaxID=461633 RepID=A0AAP0KNI2_9MAGN
MLLYHTSLFIYTPPMARRRPESGHWPPPGSPTRTHAAVAGGRSSDPSSGADADPHSLPSHTYNSLIAHSHSSSSHCPDSLCNSSPHHHHHHHHSQTSPPRTPTQTPTC